jgi:hypothetical protein
MKRLFVSTAAAVALLLAAVTAFAQQKINYRSTTYVKIAPDKEAAANEFVHTTGMKLTQELINSGRTAGFRWMRLAYAGVPAADYNYMQVIVYDGAPPAAMNPAARDQMYRKATGMSYAEYQQKLAGFGTIVGTVLSRAEAVAPGSQVAEGNYIQMVSWKITPLRGADYGNYVQKMLLPLNSQAVKEGRILGWVASRTSYPAGGDAAYDATTGTTYRDLASVLPTTPASPDQGQINFAKAFPGQNYTAFVDEGRALRRAVRVDLWRVVAAAGRGTTTTTSSR